MKLNGIAGVLCAGIVLLSGCVSTDSTKEKVQLPAEEAPVYTAKPEIFLKDGGWCWYQDPRAIINNGKLIVGGVSGQSGDVRVGVFDLDKDKRLGTNVLAEEFQPDDHDTPAFYARPNGSILAVWAKHGKEKIHYYSISDSSDYLEWNPVQQFHHVYEDKRGVTYMNLYEMQDEGLLYNFFRDGPTYNPSYITSADYGLTWDNRTHFIADEVDGRNRPYARYLQRDPKTIGISFTDAHPRNYGNSLYYADFHDGSFFDVDGRRIKTISDGPLLTSEAEKIYTGSETMAKPEGFESVPNSAWTCAMAKDSFSHPHIGYTVYLSNNDHRFRVASWNGEKWIDREIAYAGKCLYPRESSYTGLMAFDPDDPTRIFISTDVDPRTGEDLGGVHEIYAATVSATDDISTINWTPVTSKSTERNIRPLVVSKDGYKVLLWLNGPWNTYKDYSSDVVGIILQRPGDVIPRLENPMTKAYLMDNLSAQHPRLAITPQVTDQLRNKIQSDPVVGNVYKAIRLNADEMLKEDLLERKKTGRRLLSVSREMLLRMNVLGMVYLIEKDPVILNRINDELVAVCNFSDWNPSHFLDVAEMSLAVSLALDWTHGDLPDSTVTLARQALISKAILPSWDMNKGRGRSYAENNWNQVCNGGLVAAAITIAEEEPELAAKTIYRALDGLPVALQFYGPDGSHHEGSTYWNYATQYTAVIASMFESAFATDFGIWKYPGIENSGVYRLVMTAPSGWYYNYGDCGNKRGSDGDFTLAWFAAKSGDSGYLEKERFLQPAEDMGKLDRMAGIGLIWLSQFQEKSHSEIPSTWSARGVNPVVIFRDTGNDSNGYYFGAKGGCGEVNHGNMDAGSFIFELDGIRWAIDPGKQEYNAIEQTGFDLWGKTQDADRWKLLSKNNFGHSTLTVNDALHVVDGYATLIHFNGGENPSATFDLSPVYGNSINHATRTFEKDSSASLVITDQLQPTEQTKKITWQLMTTADVEPVAGGAILRQDGKSLNLSFPTHPDAMVSVVSLDPPPMDLDSQIPNLKRIELSLSELGSGHGPVTIRARLSGN